MKDYSKMSDFEINKAVLEIAKASRMSGDIVKYPHFADGSSVGLYHKMGDYYDWFNYCNNPSDAWPIINENKISIIADSGRGAEGEFMACDGFWVPGEFVWNVDSKDANPLRAAMIVYLMMKDEEK